MFKKNFKVCFIFSYILSFELNLFSKEFLSRSLNNYYSKIEELANNYNRPITVLEISSDKPKYIYQIASKYDAKCNIILLNNKNEKKILDKIKSNKFHNIALMCPKTFDHETFETLSRCESFDLVIIDDIIENFETQKERLFNSLLSLGDNIFLHLSWENTSDFLSIKDKKNAKMVYSGNNGVLFFAHLEKTFLDIARFTQYRKPRNPNSSYKIYSDFDKKLFYKDTIENATNYIPGINLITFVMLYGKYPNDEIINKKIKFMETGIPYHNDLMIGNMIVQGDNLVAIDFNDKRRNANMKRCIERALSIFNGDNVRFKDPERRIRDYYKNK